MAGHIEGDRNTHALIEISDVEGRKIATGRQDAFGRKAKLDGLGRLGMNSEAAAGDLRRSDAPNPFAKRSSCGASGDPRNSIAAVVRR